MSQGLLAWLEIEHRLLKAKRPVEAAFIAVNEAHALAPYRQAVLWNATQGAVALSGVAAIDEGAPYVLWLRRLFEHLSASFPSASVITVSNLPDGVADQWKEWLPAHALFLPLDRDALLFARDEPFLDEEIRLLERMGDLARLSRQALAPRHSLRERFAEIKNKKKFRYGAIAALALALFPVTGSVLAPGEAVPAHPVVIRAPLDGVVDRIDVKPNESVKEGEALFALDATQLTGRLNVARQEWATAEAEYRQAAQAMLFDAKAKVQATILSGKAEEKSAQAQLLESQLERIAVKSPRDGIAIFDDPTEWIGRPVAVGEKVMMVADEKDTEIEAWVSPADVGQVAPGAKLTLFLNTAPLSPVKAVVRSVAYEASARPDASLAHRVRASLAEGQEKPRLGLKGTARIDSGSVPLSWWLFRRPLAAIRQFTGI